MRQFGRVPPAVMAQCSKGTLFYMPEKMGDERAKDHFANTTALICIAHDVSEVVVILEAWIKVAAPGETLDPTERPSEALDRREVVVLSGEARGSKRQKFLPIIRTDAGGFFGFGESDLPEFLEADQEWCLTGQQPVHVPSFGAVFEGGAGLVDATLSAILLTGVVLGWRSTRFVLYSAAMSWSGKVSDEAMRPPCQRQAMNARSICVSPTAEGQRFGGDRRSET